LLARTTLNKLRVRLGTFEAKCQKQVFTLLNARRQLEFDAHSAVVATLSKHVQSLKEQPEILFKRLCQGGADIPLSEIRTFIGKIPDSTLKPTQLDIGFRRYSVGISKMVWLGMMQEYVKCVKDIAMTNIFEVKDSKTLRKLRVGEVIGFLEQAGVEGSTSLSRVRCRAILDGTEGYATLKGNQGTSFLEKCAKPFYCCDREVQLHEAFQSRSPVVRTLQQGEVLEVLQGPQREEEGASRLKGRSLRDGSEGWLTLSRRIVYWFPHYKCEVSTPLTDALEVKSGNTLRALDVGERLDALDGPAEDKASGSMRVRVRADKDGLSGFATISGANGAPCLVSTQV